MWRRSEELRLLADDTWAELVRHEPYRRATMGDRTSDGDLPDISEEGWNRFYTAMRGLKVRFETLQAHHGEFSSDDLMVKDSIERNIDWALDTEAFQYPLWDLNHVTSGNRIDYQTILGIQGKVTLAVRNAEDVDHLVARYEKVPRLFEQRRANLENGLSRGLSASKPAISRVISEIEKQIPTDVATSPFMGVMNDLPASWTDEQKSLARSRVRTVIAEKVNPALSQYLTFLKETLLLRARDTIGLSDLPNGAAMYAARIRSNADSDLSAQSIHEMGLRELAKVKAEMEPILRRVVPDAPPGDPIAVLRTITARPDQQPPAGEAFFTLARSFVTIAQQKVTPIWGSNLASLDPMLVDTSLNPTDPVASYLRSPPGSSVPARIFFNPVAKTPLMDVAYVTYHEYTHHLQFTSNNMSADLPTLTRSSTGMSTASFEGAALFSERLAGEAGLYDDLQTVAMLNGQAWRAARLVVDTGIHGAPLAPAGAKWTPQSMGWSRAQAIQFLLANTALSQAAIELEVDRYIAIPGQALAYMIGQLDFAKLREQVKEALGDNYDQAAFLGFVNRSIGATLPTRHEIVSRWLAEQPHKTH